ncbi:MAG TPA: hypothetical protein VNH40_04805, partial [Gaiellaceae bacterium]|nr:hypothetical protein [Gaiellaceae bacterium]
GVTLARIDEHLQTLRGLGLAGEHLDRVALELEATATVTGARRPEPPRNALSATLVQMLVLEEELRSRRMRGYGPLDAAAAAVLDEHAQRLIDETNRLIAHLERADR